MYKSRFTILLKSQAKVSILLGYILHFKLVGVMIIKRGASADKIHGNSYHINIYVCECVCVCVCL